MKIELKLTADQISAVAKLTASVYDLRPSINPSEKLVASIIYDVTDIFSAKQKELHKKASLFDANKRYKMTLKYHEAIALTSTIISLLPTVNDDYNRTILDKLKNEIHKKTI